MTAVSMNVGGGVRLFKPANLYMRTQNGILSGQTHGAGCARPCFCTAELIREHRYENWNPTTKQVKQILNMRYGCTISVKTKFKRV